MSGFRTLLLLSVLATAIASPASQSSSLHRRQLLPAWTSQGCYTDAPGTRTLKGASTVSSSMTVETCISFCFNAGFRIAGVEYGTECFCDDAIQSPGAPTTASECDMACAGNSKQVCGAGNRINIYKGNGPGASSPPVVAGWQYEGCYADSVGDRSLPTQMSLSGGATIEKCVAACDNGGFSFAGLEYADECFCGSSLESAGKPASECSMTCKGNRDQFCGGPDRLTVYRKPGPPTPPPPPPPPPPNPCEGRPRNLCCMAPIAPWSTNSGVWGGICGYTPPSPSELIGGRCITRPTTGCPTGTFGTCCAGFVPGQCSLGTNCR
ncbi:hypothetical protein ONZ45_g12635 [Pleurotus djamor]|nr:hypothetical protein ONZ45_g12635 [Pleurotus djamor]